MCKQLYINNGKTNNARKSFERSSVIDTFFVFNRKPPFHRKVRITKAFKNGERTTRRKLGLPDRGVKGNFRDCFSRFLRYRLDISRHNGGTRIYHDLADTIAGKAACGRVPLFAPFSARTDDGASTGRGESGKISRPRDQTEWTACFSSPVTSISRATGEKDRWSGWKRDRIREEEMEGEESERGTFSIYKYKPSRQFQLLSVVCIGCQFQVYTLYSDCARFSSARPRVFSVPSFSPVQSSIDFVIVQPGQKDGYVISLALHILWFFFQKLFLKVETFHLSKEVPGIKSWCREKWREDKSRYFEIKSWTCKML